MSSLLLLFIVFLQIMSGIVSFRMNSTWIFSRSWFPSVNSFRSFVSKSNSSGSQPKSADTTPLIQPKPKIIFVLGGELCFTEFFDVFLFLFTRFSLFPLCLGPGAGKGTQCEMLSKEFDICHLSAGELLRNERLSGSKDGLLIDSYLKEGRIVPVSFSLNLLQKEICNRNYQRYLIDGFPRNNDNLSGWMLKMPTLCDLEMVVEIRCNQSNLEKRILERSQTSQRNDDNLETLKKRFTVFEKESLPVIHYFQEMSTPSSPSPIDMLSGGFPSFQFVSVNGDSSKEEVNSEIKSHLMKTLEKDLKGINEELFNLLLPISSYTSDREVHLLSKETKKKIQIEKEKERISFNECYGITDEVSKKLKVRFLFLCLFVLVISVFKSGGSNIV
jgi:UMP-CMP kinase